MSTKNILAFLVAASILFLSACKCKDGECGYEVPDTYSFSNVDISGQQTRLGMLEEMVAYMKTGKNQGTVLDASLIRNMFANANAPFSDSEFNTSGKSLQSKCFYLDTTEILGWMDNLALASQSQVAGSNGQAGIVTSPTSASHYLLDANGQDLQEIIEKGIMGAVLYYQMTAVYLSDDQIGPTVDNTTPVAGQGTAMEHHWDEAFGYFGVPFDYPTNTSDLYFIGEYCDEFEPVMQFSSTLMTSWTYGRAAISNDDMETKDAMVPIIRRNIELVFAAGAIHYLNRANDNLADDAIRSHALSEGVGFIRALKYNPEASITTTQINDILNLIGSNFYQVTQTGLTQARDQLSSILGLDEYKNAL
ncbi:MAG: DUF4856 domain-containing protein [Bacteroidia bacterium]|nr:DUF4856 domain-containing protein [Bacteroidia bacterium]